MSRIQDMIETLENMHEEDLDRLEEWVNEGIYEKRQAFSGMSYESGVDAMLDFLSGNLSLDDLCEERS